MRFLTLILIVCVFSNCSAQEKSIRKLSGLEEKEFKNYQKITTTKLISDDEVGKKLFICFQLVDAKSNKPMANKSVFFYQAAVDGDYHPEKIGDPKTARIKGTGITNAKGQIFVETILPGNYGVSEDVRHIHFIISDVKPSNYDVFFEQYLSDAMKNRIYRNNQMFMVDLKKNSKNKWVGFLKIKVAN